MQNNSLSIFQSKHQLMEEAELESHAEDSEENISKIRKELFFKGITLLNT